MLEKARKEIVSKIAQMRSRPENLAYGSDLDAEEWAWGLVEDVQCWERLSHAERRELMAFAQGVIAGWWAYSRWEND